MLYDVAAAISKGRREYQEDALALDFSDDSRFGFVVLSDGMGGHAAGDVASQIVVSEITEFLRVALENEDIPSGEIPNILREAAKTANSAIDEHVRQNKAVAGMGATALVPILDDDQIHWLSIGDSPLFLFEGDVLRQINEDHSMAPQIDLMVKTGMLDEETAMYHPDRNCLTSVLMGADIPKIDCGKPPITLQPGMMVIVSSDGLQTLTNEEIQKILIEQKAGDCEGVTNALMKALREADDPDQDNISLAVIKVS